MKIFVSLALGFVLGYFGLVKGKALEVNNKLQTVWLFLLIFMMGMSIGMDKTILSSLPTLGGKAVVFTIACTAGSILVVYIISRLFFEKEER